MLFLASCSFNPFTDDNQLTGNAAGPVIGGAAGAGTTALLGAPKSVIALAGIGGAGAGYYVTTLRHAAGGVLQAGGQVYQMGDFVTIVIPSDQLFESNSDELLPQATPALQSALSVLKRYPDNNILISGNTSGFGTTRHEHRLSEDRARQVAALFWSQGISRYKNASLSTRKLRYTGYGYHFPIANSIEVDSIRQNSRIQITSYPSKMELQLDERCKVLNNIGGMDNPPLTKNQRDEALNKSFSGDLLPENNPATSQEGLDERSSFEVPASGSERHYYPENVHYKGDTWDEVSNASREFQTDSAVNVPKQGGYKDES